MNEYRVHATVWEWLSPRSTEALRWQKGITVLASDAEDAKRRALTLWKLPRPGTRVTRIEATRSNPLAAGGSRLENPARKRKPKAPTGGDWNLDLWGGAGMEREGRTRAEQLELARDEMRRSGSADLFDFLADQDKRRNPDGEFTEAEEHAHRRLERARREADRYRGVEMPYWIRDELAAAWAELGRARQGAPPRPPRRRRRNPADTPEMRYQRAVGHGERPATARTAARNPGRAVGRMAPNCPLCGALVRLPNPVPPRVTCHQCGGVSQVRRP